MFRFRLDFLLKYRRQLEETEMYELANRVREVNRIEDDINSIRLKSAELAGAARKRALATVTVPILALYSNFLHELRKKGLASQNQLTLAEGEVEKQRETLRQASIRRKTMEKLEEIERKSFLDAEAKAEYKILDELGVIRFKRHNDEK